jgi:uncharacterized surface protein with fasciclin (FAS1) repeats
MRIKKTLAAATAAAAALAGVALAAPAQATTDSRSIADALVEQNRGAAPGSFDPAFGKRGFSSGNWYDFDILLAAVKANGGVVAAAATATPAPAITVFAPNDRAFQVLAYQLTGKWTTSEEKVFSTIAGITGAGSGSLLDTVLKYHVADGKLLAADVLADPTVDTLAGVSFTAKPILRGNAVMLVDKDPGLVNPVLLRTDITPGGAAVHTISGVLAPADLPNKR